MMVEKLSLGIIGVGRIGKIHAENITNSIPQAEVAAVSDVRLDGIKEWAAGLGINMVYSDYKKIIGDPGIDAVLVCSSTDTHAEISIEAARAGKHIFCEKPIDFDLNRIKDVISEVEKSRVKFQVGFNRRFDHNFSKVKNMVMKGLIGDPHIIKITSRDPEAPPIEYVKASGGIFLDMTIHDFDMVRYLSGSEVEEVYVNGAVLVNEEIGKVGDIDTAVISLKLANGVIAVIDNSRQAVYGYDQRAEVFGSKGRAEVDNDCDTSASLATSEGIFSDKPKYFFLERYTESFITEMGAFISAVLNDQDTAVSVEDGLKPVLIGLAAKKSYQENRPVKISEVEK